MKLSLETVRTMHNLEIVQGDFREIDFERFKKKLKFCDFGDFCSNKMA